jgi:hypothetical protein
VRDFRVGFYVAAAIALLISTAYLLLKRGRHKPAEDYSGIQGHNNIERMR